MLAYGPTQDQMVEFLSRVQQVFSSVMSVRISCCAITKKGERCKREGLYGRDPEHLYCDTHRRMLNTQ